jgi:ABC-type uncharacterized transport system involved in gliding motility auxiliary subunit
MILRRLSVPLSLSALFAAYLGLMYFIQHAVPPVRLDLTENRLFTLSEGSERIIDKIQRPVLLSLYYSEEEARPYPQFRQYAERVIEKIDEYAAQSGGMITLKRIDPEPYSVPEDQAIAEGIVPIPLEDGSGPLYFGLTAQANGKAQTIGFIKPESEQYLEYELSKLIQSVQSNEKPKVVLLSDLPVSGDGNAGVLRSTPAWVVYRQLSERYELAQLSPADGVLPADIDVLWIMHPRAWPDRMIEQVRVYIENGGHAVIMVDPYAESVPAITPTAEPVGNSYLSSYMPALFARWGIGYDPSQAVLDSKYAWLMQLDENQFPKRNPALISLPPEAMNQRDVVTADLDRIVLSSAGALTIGENSPLDIEPLLQSSDSSKLIGVGPLREASEDPERLLNKFVSSQEPFVLAARFSGKLQPEGKSAKPVNFIVIADTDMLSDRLWVLENNLFGQPVFSAQASNGDFFFNIIDQLSGSEDLISIRSRGMVSRPFVKVDQIRRTAEQAYRDSQVQLLANLEKVQNDINALQTGVKNPLNQPDGKRSAALLAEKIKLRQQLRRIQGELNDDVDRLGQTVKLINIFTVPVLLLLLAWFVRFRRRMHQDFSRVGHGTL